MGITSQKEEMQKGKIGILKHLNANAISKRLHIFLYAIAIVHVLL
jgi:hypothetical protein